MGMERKLLEHLYNIPEIDYCDLIKYFNEHYPDPHVDNFLKQVRAILLEFVGRKDYITLDGLPYGDFGTKVDYKGQNVMFDFNIAKDYWGEMKAKLTLTGRKYVEELRKEELQERTNAGLKKNSDAQKLTAIIVGAATIANAIIAGFNYNLTKQNHKEQTIQTTQSRHILTPSQPRVPYR